VDIARLRSSRGNLPAAGAAKEADIARSLRRRGNLPATVALK